MKGKFGGIYLGSSTDMRRDFVGYFEYEFIIRKEVEDVVLIELRMMANNKANTYRDFILVKPGRVNEESYGEIVKIKAYFEGTK